MSKFWEKKKAFSKTAFSSDDRTSVQKHPIYWQSQGKKTPNVLAYTGVLEEQKALTCAREAETALSKLR